MADARHILAIDQGTASTRAILFDSSGNPVQSAQRELPQIFPQPGWVEHDAEEIWSATIEVCREVLKSNRNVAALGLTNQRETTILWDRDTGTPIHNAIVWQDRRTAQACRDIAAAGHTEMISARTGLLPDAYFSASKIAWMLDNIDGARDKAEAGELAFGTVDSFLLWRLTGGAVHATDATNASRTMLFDIHKQEWSSELLELWDIPDAILPDVRDSAGDFGTTGADTIGVELPIRGIAGDQQAATIGQACFAPGMVKSTFGTGCFVLINTGATPIASNHKLLTTVAYRLAGQTTYAIEGSVFVAGAAVQWLRDALQVIGSAPETETLARDLGSNNGVYMVPAFTGLGAPHWDPDARGAILGLTRDSGIAEIVRASLEAVAYQTRDLLDAMSADLGTTPATIRIDGGMATNNWLMQFLADILDVPMARPRVTETTALGAAMLAGLGAGLYGNLEEIAEQWCLDRKFKPNIATAERERLLAGWQDAVGRTLSRSP
ncbi:MAG: glycerol kinase GlpK [Alphaproteobacteria bacterium]|nr:glycerol kinase GlpK [Alphaproteobacteria bacterium]